MGSPVVGEDLWWEGFAEQMCFKSGMEERGSDGWCDGTVHGFLCYGVQLFTNRRAANISEKLRPVYSFYDRTQHKPSAILIS